MGAVASTGAYRQNVSGYIPRSINVVYAVSTRPRGAGAFPGVDHVPGFAAVDAMRPLAAAAGDFAWPFALTVAGRSSAGGSRTPRKRTPLPVGPALHLWLRASRAEDQRRHEPNVATARDRLSFGVLTDLDPRELEQHGLATWRTTSRALPVAPMVCSGGMP